MHRRPEPDHPEGTPPPSRFLRVLPALLLALPPVLAYITFTAVDLTPRVEHYGKGRLIPPAGTGERLRYTYWLHYAEGTLMPLMVMSLIFNRVERAPWPVRPIAKLISGQVRRGYLRPNIEANLDFLESELGKTVWFAGDELTAADVQMSFALEAAAARGGLDQSRPKLAAFLERVRARAAYQRAQEKGGPYKLLS